MPIPLAFPDSKQNESAFPEAVCVLWAAASPCLGRPVQKPQGMLLCLAGSTWTPPTHAWEGVDQLCHTMRVHLLSCPCPLILVRCIAVYIAGKEPIIQVGTFQGRTEDQAGAQGMEHLGKLVHWQEDTSGMGLLREQRLLPRDR